MKIGNDDVMIEFSEVETDAEQAGRLVRKQDSYMVRYD